MKKVSSSEKYLKVILLVLGVLVAGLTIVVIVVNVNKPNITFYNSNDVGVDCSRIDKLTSVEDIAGCLTYEYDNGDKELAIKKFKQAIDDAYAEGDEEKIVALSSDFSYVYLNDGKCDEAFAVTEEDDRAPTLSAEARLGFYNTLIDISLECGDSERVELYEEFSDRIWGSDAMEIPDLESEENHDNEEVYESEE